MFRIRGAVLERIGLPRPYARSKPIDVAELDLAPPAAGELRVRIEAAGVCHSDLSVVDGTRVRPVPMLLGHEAAGVVEQVGDGVGDVAVGSGWSWRSCRAAALPGLRHRRPYPVRTGQRRQRGRDLARRRDAAEPRRSPGVPPSRRIWLCDPGCGQPGQRGAGRLRRSANRCRSAGVCRADRWRCRAQCRQTETWRHRGGRRLGGVGMAAVLTALAHNDIRVVGVDQLPEKLATVRAFGAHEAYTPQQASEAGVKAAVVIEAVGHAAALQTAIELTAAGGRTITVGLPPPETRISLSPLGFVAEGRALIGSYLGSAVPGRDIPGSCSCGDRAGCRWSHWCPRESVSTRSTRRWTSWPMVPPFGN
ncbi:zinc-binding dehydrogenase family protein [Mycobacterium xenopi 3993]|nr:zinc-binding dehydrogenase family protein [Mycobacterium xenopi 3993]